MAQGQIINVNPGQGGMIERDGQAPIKFAASSLLDGVACTLALVGRKVNYFESAEEAGAGRPPAINVQLL
jgi:hypothetical protein